MNTVSEPFAEALRARRDDFNNRFATVRRARPHLDGGMFTSFLLAAVDPLVSKVANVRAGSVHEVSSAAYDAVLELAAAGLIGPRYRVIEQGWKRILPAAVELVIEAPNQVIGAISNALHQLAVTNGARPMRWIASLESLAPLCRDVPTLLRAGQLAAWRSGLAHFRAGALPLADDLPEKIVAAALRLPDGQEWREVRDRLERDPWFEPGGPPPLPGTLRLAEAGSFRGFGGLFVEPPRVAAMGEDLLVRSGEGCWQLTADAFGATFHRASTAEFDGGKSGQLPPEIRHEGTLLKRGETQLALGGFGPFTSVAFTSTTLAITAAHTHAVLLVART